jgi:hypothetical protein
MTELGITLPPPGEKKTFFYTRSSTKQTEIADHISALRTQAKQLQQQAEVELAQAKQQVERMILGE